MHILQSSQNPLRTHKIYLLREERAALANFLRLPDDLKKIVRDDIYLVNSLTFDWDAVTELGLRIPHSSNQEDFHYYPITWLNTPVHCKKHLKAHSNNSLQIILRRPSIQTNLPYDFPRALISVVKSNQGE